MYTHLFLLSTPTPCKGRWTFHPQQTGLACKRRHQKNTLPTVLVTLLVYLSTTPCRLFWHQKERRQWQTRSKGQFAGLAALTGPSVVLSSGYPKYKGTKEVSLKVMRHGETQHAVRALHLPGKQMEREKDGKETGRSADTSDLPFSFLQPTLSRDALLEILTVTQTRTSLVSTQPRRTTIVWLLASP